MRIEITETGYSLISEGKKDQRELAKLHIGDTVRIENPTLKSHGRVVQVELQEIDCATEVQRQRGSFHF